MPTLVKPSGNQDHELALNNDPCLMPCKSALGDDGTSTTFKRDPTEVAITKVLPAAAAGGVLATGAVCAPAVAEHFVPDNELDAATNAGEQAGPVAPREEGFAGSKAEADLAYAKEWLASQPEVLARVQDVMRHYDAKHYQCNSSSNVPFWRKVLNDLVGKAGQSTLAGGDTANVSSADDEPLDGYNEDDGFFAVDLARVVVQYAKFKRHLPRLHPHYAMKCNNATPMLAMISALGGRFDCASKGEFCAVLDGGFQTAENIIYAHPDKMINNIQAANRRGVYMCTFDNEDEVEKLRRYMPKAQAVLRIATDDSAAVCEFSTKFGCPFSQTQALLQCAKDYGIEVIGVSFHVGSGNGSADAYYKALRDARDIFDRAELLGFNMRLLDIGGGFLGSDPNPKSGKLSFEQIAQAVRPVIDELFPSHVHVIAEPGRFFAESPYALAMAIHSKRKLTKRDGSVEVQYYTSDGKYQSYNCMIYDHADPNIHVLRPDAEAAIRTTTIFGPTCDGIDWIMKGHPFPALDVGDWIFSCDFGAYTMAAGSTFNGFSTKRIEYITSIDVLAM